MLYTLEGKLSIKDERFAVVEAGGVGFRVRLHERAIRSLPRVGSTVRFFTYLHVREDALELYGFASADELRLFELLNSVAGVGPKSALAVLDVAELRGLEAAIKEGRPDLLTRASGIGKKTAERIILELKNKVVVRGAGAAVRKMETDADIEETLTGLGYGREEVREALANSRAVGDLEIRLKDALKILGGGAKSVGNSRVRE